MQERGHELHCTYALHNSPYTPMTLAAAKLLQSLKVKKNKSEFPPPFLIFLLFVTQSVHILVNDIAAVIAVIKVISL